MLCMSGSVSVIATLRCANTVHYISNWPLSCMSGNAVQDMYAVFNTHVCGIFWGYILCGCGLWCIAAGGAVLASVSFHEQLQHLRLA